MVIAAGHIPEGKNHNLAPPSPGQQDEEKERTYQGRENADGYLHLEKYPGDIIH